MGFSTSVHCQQSQQPRLHSLLKWCAPNAVLTCWWYVTREHERWLAFLQAEWIPMIWLPTVDRHQYPQPGGTQAPSMSPPVPWWSERRTDSSVMILPGIWTCHVAKEAEPSCFNDTWNWRAAASLPDYIHINAKRAFLHAGDRQG